MRVSMGVLMQQGQHSLERLFRGSELLHALKLCLSCCYVTPRATPFALTHPVRGHYNVRRLVRLGLHVAIRELPQTG